MLPLDARELEESDARSMGRPAWPVAEPRQHQDSGTGVGRGFASRRVFFCRRIGYVTFRRREAQANRPTAATASKIAAAGSGTAAAEPPTALPASPCDTGRTPPGAAAFPDVLSYPPIVAGVAVAALSAISLELIGDEAASSAPMPAPLPKTNRPPAAIVTNPLPANALGVAMSSVPPLTVVPPVYVFVPLSVNAPLPESAKALLPMMLPANVVVEPEDGATVNVER